MFVYIKFGVQKVSTIWSSVVSAIQEFLMYWSLWELNGWDFQNCKYWKPTSTTNLLLGNPTVCTQQTHPGSSSLSHTHHSTFLAHTPPPSPQSDPGHQQDGHCHECSWWLHAVKICNFNAGPPGLISRAYISIVTWSIKINVYFFYCKQ